MAELYLADTNVYVGAANEPAFRQRFEAFIRDHGPLVVSAVVVAEVLVGIADAARHPAAVRALTAGAVPLAPTPEDWIAAAAIVTHLGVRPSPRVVPSGTTCCSLPSAPGLARCS